LPQTPQWSEHIQRSRLANVGLSDAMAADATL
jgi:hypothetical protein